LSIDATVRAALLSLVAAHAGFGVSVPVFADKSAPAAPKKVAVLIFDGVQIIDYSRPYEVGFGTVTIDSTVSATVLRPPLHHRRASAVMTTPASYPIGTPGLPWGEAEVATWLSRQTVKRSYETDVLRVIETLSSRYDVVKYGHLDYHPDKYPLFAIKSRDWRNSLPCALVTGGVHGYETSGVHGALQFVDKHAATYEGRINLVVAPCVSPWAYEVIHRWNMHAVDPNRSFRDGSPAQESAALMRLVAPFRDGVLVHIDLHETTDTDETEFRPALAARDGVAHVPGEIPDGFYLVDDSENPQPEFQQAVLAAVAKVTHIAIADRRDEIIGSPMVSPGVIHYPLKQLGLCASITHAYYKTTTEVYPDSPRATPEQCNSAQVAAVCAAIDFALEHGVTTSGERSSPMKRP
jgi:hypothetical protein